MKPKSIINHNTVIPKNTARYREEFDMISLPKANQLWRQVPQKWGGDPKPKFQK